jgi:hypothetical protein
MLGHAAASRTETGVDIYTDSVCDATDMAEWASKCEFEAPSKESFVEFEARGLRLGSGVVCCRKAPDWEHQTVQPGDLTL